MEVFHCRTVKIAELHFDWLRARNDAAVSLRLVPKYAYLKGFSPEKRMKMQIIKVCVCACV